MNRALPVFLASSALLFCGAAHAQWWNPSDMTPPKFRGTTFEPKVVYTSELVYHAKSAANGFLFSDKFDQLERMHSEFMASGLRATDGTYMVEAIQATFGESFLVMDEKLAQGVMRSWEKKAPQSELRPIALAVMHQAQAWKARGGGYGAPEETMRIFRERLRLAAVVLKENEAAGEKSPIWWWAALVVAGSSGVEAAQFDRAFEDAVTRFPSYKPLYYTRMNYLLPQWGGSFEAVDRFVADSVARTAATEGESMYAWLYLDIAAKTRERFEQTGVSWTRMKKGFEDLVERYPDLRNRNAFATFACRARDRETTAKLLRELGDKAALGAASPGITTEGCRRFAFTST